MLRGGFVRAGGIPGREAVRDQFYSAEVAPRHQFQRRGGQAALQCPWEACVVHPPVQGAEVEIGAFVDKWQTV